MIHNGVANLEKSESPNGHRRHACLGFRERTLRQFSLSLPIAETTEGLFTTCFESGSRVAVAVPVSRTVSQKHYTTAQKDFSNE